MESSASLLTVAAASAAAPSSSAAAATRDRSTLSADTNSGSSNRRRSVYQISFSENNPTLVFRDRCDAQMSSSDLKEAFAGCANSAGGVSSEARSRARFLCAKYLGGAWRRVQGDAFRLRTITGGMSNLLFLVELPEGVAPDASEPTRALLRIHCQADTEQLLSESVVFTLLSERALGPKLLGVFPGGRFEQFIPSRPLKCAEISQLKMVGLIAPMLARVHTLDVPVKKTPGLLDTARGWLERFRELPAGKLPVKLYLTEARIPADQYPSEVSADELVAELDWVEKCVLQSSSPIVFSHNDLQEGNILLADGVQVLDDGTVQPSDKDPLTLIDFEYCSYNFRGFDLGNHACEHLLDYDCPDPPYYRIAQDQEEQAQARRRFCAAYLSEVYALKSSGDNPHFPSDLVTGDRERDLHTLEAEIDRFQPVSHLFWSLWALMNAELNTALAFHYADYARDRLALFFHQRSRLAKYLQQE